MWRSEDRKNPRNSGNTKAEYNVLLTAQFFFVRKREKVEKITGHILYLDVALSFAIPLPFVCYWASF